MFMSQNRLDQEHSMLNRLAIGLINEGEQVTRVIPPFQNNDTPEYEKVVSIIPRLLSPTHIPLLQRKEKHAALFDALKKAKTTSIVSFGNSSFSLSCSMATQLEIPIFQEIYSIQQVKRVKRRSIVKRWLAATPSIERAIIEKVGQGRCSLVPLGITPALNQEQTFDSQTQCIIVLNASDDAKETRSVLGILKKIPNTHVFLECKGRKDHKVWASINDLNMHGQATCLRDVASLRKLIPQADLLVLPFSRMEVSSVLLETMDSGVPVISTHIPGFDMLVDGETAIVVDQSWEQSIKSLLDDSDLRSRIANNARKLISMNYGSAAQIAAFQAAITPF